MTRSAGRVRLPDARSAALQIGAGRTVIAAAIMAAPVPAARLFGADSATAARVTWLTRMMAVRDGALGVGTVASVRSGHGGPWVLAGAVCDALDCAVVVGALRTGRMRGLLPGGIALGAAGAAAVGGLSAGGLSVAGRRRGAGPGAGTARVRRRG